MDRRSYVYGVGYETVRRSEVVDNLERFRAEGDLPRLWAAIRRAKLDVSLEEAPSVTNMADLLARATKHKLICENVARRVAKATLTTKDVRVLEKALHEIEQLKLGPKLWKDPQYPFLRKVEALVPHLETLRYLAQEHRAGGARYCTAWLDVIDSGKLSDSFDLEVSTGRWLLVFPDADVQLGGIVSDGVMTEYWRLVESIEGAKPQLPSPSNTGEFVSKDNHLAQILVLAGSVMKSSRTGAEEKQSFRGT